MSMITEYTNIKLKSIIISYLCIYHPIYDLFIKSYL